MQYMLNTKINCQALSRLQEMKFSQKHIQTLQHSSQYMRNVQLYIFPLTPLAAAYQRQYTQRQQHNTTTLHNPPEPPSPSTPLHNQQEQRHSLFRNNPIQLCIHGPIQIIETAKIAFKGFSFLLQILLQFDHVEIALNLMNFCDIASCK